MTLHLVEHPLVAHYLTRLRDRETTPDEFREASDKIITLLLYEATRDLRTRTYRIQTPLEETNGYAIGDRVVAVPILRAGLGLVGPVLELLPHVTVGHRAGARRADGGGLPLLRQATAGYRRQSRHDPRPDAGDRWHGDEGRRDH